MLYCYRRSAVCSPGGGGRWSPHPVGVSPRCRGQQWPRPRGRRGHHRGPTGGGRSGGRPLFAASSAGLEQRRLHSHVQWQWAGHIGRGHGADWTSLQAILGVRLTYYWVLLYSAVLSSQADSLHPLCLACVDSWQSDSCRLCFLPHSSQTLKVWASLCAVVRVRFASDGLQMSQTLKVWASLCAVVRVRFSIDGLQMSLTLKVWASLCAVVRVWFASDGLQMSLTLKVWASLCAVIKVRFAGDALQMSHYNMVCAYHHVVGVRFACGNQCRSCSCPLSHRP